MNGKTTMQVNQGTALEAFQLWANKHFKTPVKLTMVQKLSTEKGGYSQQLGSESFELTFEPICDGQTGD